MLVFFFFPLLPLTPFLDFAFEMCFPSLRASRAPVQPGRNTKTPHSLAQHLFSLEIWQRPDNSACSATLKQRYLYVWGLRVLFWSRSKEGSSTTTQPPAPWVGEAQLDSSVSGLSGSEGAFPKGKPQKECLSGTGYPGANNKLLEIEKKSEQLLNCPCNSQLCVQVAFLR